MCRRERLQRQVEPAARGIVLISDLRAVRAAEQQLVQLLPSHVVDAKCDLRLAIRQRILGARLGAPYGVGRKWNRDVGRAREGTRRVDAGAAIAFGDGRIQQASVARLIGEVGSGCHRGVTLRRRMLGGDRDGEAGVRLRLLAFIHGSTQSDARSQSRRDPEIRLAEQRDLRRANARINGGAEVELRIGLSEVHRLVHQSLQVVLAHIRIERTCHPREAGFGIWRSQPNFPRCGIDDQLVGKSRGVLIVNRVNRQRTKFSQEVIGVRIGVVDQRVG